MSQNLETLVHAGKGWVSVKDFNKVCETLFQRIDELEEQLGNCQTNFDHPENIIKSKTPNWWPLKDYLKDDWGNTNGR